jgi:hypothetical protein
VWPVILGQLELTMALALASLPALSFLLVSLVPRRWRNSSHETTRSSANRARPVQNEKHTLVKGVDGRYTVIYSSEMGEIKPEKEYGIAR